MIKVLMHSSNTIQIKYNVVYKGVSYMSKLVLTKFCDWIVENCGLARLTFLKHAYCAHRLTFLYAHCNATPLNELQKIVIFKI